MINHLSLQNFRVLSAPQLTKVPFFIKVINITHPTWPDNLWIESEILESQNFIDASSLAVTTTSFPKGII